MNLTTTAGLILLMVWTGSAILFRSILQSLLQLLNTLKFHGDCDAVEFELL